MQRRRFLAISLAATTLAATGKAHASMSTQSSSQNANQPREYYLLRRYQLQNGPQTKLTESYFAAALIPALSRLGLGPIGAFVVDIGADQPAYYLLIPGASLDTLVNLDFHLAEDPAFLKSAEPFWSAPATGPAFQRIESSILSAFTGWPKLTPPHKEKRVLQLRIYESPSHAAHIRKVDMFNHGEFAIFTKSGFHNIFFAATLIGPRLPSLTYMISAPDVPTLLQYWTAFQNDPEWKQLSTSPRYNYEEIVSSITSLILRPLPCSQI